jgi:hypothetical protein
LKTTQPFSVAAHFRRQHFDCDAIPEQNVPRTIDRAHATAPEQRFNLILAIEGTTDERVRIFLQDFAVSGTKTYVVVVLVIAGGTKLHAELSLQRKPDR